MEQRALGGSGLKIAPLVFGGNVFGWTIDEAQSFAVLDAFVDHGFNAIDTALARLSAGDLCLILIDQVEEALAYIHEKLRGA